MNCKTPTQAILVKPQQKSNGFRIPRWKKSSFLVGNVDVTFFVFFWGLKACRGLNRRQHPVDAPRNGWKVPCDMKEDFPFRFCTFPKKMSKAMMFFASAESLSCCHQWIVASASQKRLQRSNAVVSHRSGQYIYIRKWLIFLLKMLMLFFPERFWESTPEKIPVPIRWALSALSLKILKPKAILMKIPASKNPKQFLSTQMEGPGKDMDRNVKMFGGIFSFEVPSKMVGWHGAAAGQLDERSTAIKSRSNLEPPQAVCWLEQVASLSFGFPFFSRRQWFDMNPSVWNYIVCR